MVRRLGLDEKITKALAEVRRSHRTLRKVAPDRVRHWRAFRQAAAALYADTHELFRLIKETEGR